VRPTGVVELGDPASFAIALALALAASFASFATKEVGLAAAAFAALGRVLASALGGTGRGIMALTAAVATGRA